MQRKLKERMLVTLAATILMAVLGTLGGYLLGRALSLKLAQRKLAQDADRMIAIVEMFSQETRTALAQIKAAQLPFCSDAEMVFVRTLIFQSHYLKDGGHIRDGRIVCSATLSSLEMPKGQIDPDITQPDGTRIYREHSPILVRDLHAVVVQLGDSYVVYTPHILDFMHITTSHFILRTPSAPQFALASGNTAGLTPAKQLLIDQVTSREGYARVDDTYYVTRCSARYYKCVSANISIPEALSADGNMLILFSSAGGATGALLGFLFSFLYRRNRSMEQQLRRAIRQDKLRVVYQPIVKMVNRRIAGAEALVRWNDEEGNAVGPDVFIRIAEERGFVGEITKLVVRHTLREMGETLRGNAEFRLSINVAAADLTDPGFLPMLEEKLREAGVSTKQLAIEITESSTARQDVAVAAIRQLRKMGHEVHIDDFGTGYSSLSYLHTLSIDAIKIDRSFTQAVGTEAVTLSILPQILAMAQALKLQVVVEGVETREQADYFVAMKDSGAILEQGWLYGRPVAAEAFRERMDADLLQAEEEQRRHTATQAA